VDRVSESQRVVADHAEVIGRAGITTPLVHQRAAEPAGEAFHHAGAGRPLQVEVVFILGESVGTFRIEAMNPRGVGAEPVEQGKIIAGPDEESVFAGPVEILDLGFLGSYSRSSVRVLRDFHAEAGKEPAGGGKRAADFHLDPVDAGAVAVVGHID
jgi:hypothetical protein